ncbi:MAG: endonuclease [FCB group bacterium]|nr:endonuclease [FCB group bacterium]MBL7029517.1 endonuclease [Candidatus Neomarinimicrobiota bacterium]MBL7122944.1 endonuclease [Candidatus Neomarinimicrobiota bacterium]
MKHIFLIYTLSLTALWAQIPNGYYDTASGLTGTPLQQALHDIIDDHNVVSYGSLWTHYETTDVKPNGKVWDMYSDIPGGTPAYEFDFVIDQDHGTGGSSEGEFFNREHSWPKSWFNDTSPMDTDIFHVVPSDKHVNNRRGSYPYGEVSSPTWTSTNGCKLGANSYPGYSGTVFEPIDAYKGDFARIYFYMSTRYLNEDSSWPGSPMVDGAQLEQWALDMLMEWHAEDPVSQKEIDRNNDIYNHVQFNRNPFVDHPNYVDLIWGDPPALPLAPSNFHANYMIDNSARLIWTDNALNEHRFYFYHSNGEIIDLPDIATSLLVSNLTPQQTYNYSISSYNEAGESDRVELTFTFPTGVGTSVDHFIEDFESGLGSSYVDGAILLASGTWTSYQAGNYSLGTPYSGTKCLSINEEKPGAHLTTPVVNTMGSMSFYYYQRNGAATDEFLVQKSVDGGDFETLITQSYAVGETYTHFSIEINDTSNSVRMRIANDNQAGHLIIDDLTMTPFGLNAIEEFSTHIPSVLSLNPAYPNPFNPEVTLSFQIHATSESIQIQIFDIQGQLVDSPVQNTYTTGAYSVKWAGTNQHGEPQPSGLYVVRLSSSQGSIFQRITLLR